MNRVLSEIEQLAIQNRVKSMDASEIECACRVVPTNVLLNEINRRFTLQEQQIAECKGALEM